MAERRPSITQIKNAAEVLARAARLEAQKIREQEGGSGHLLASELEDAGYSAKRTASLLEARRRAERHR